MKLISHRGNINGRQPGLENTQKYIDQAISLGYNVEIDIWFEKDKLYLGHDPAGAEVNVEWLMSRSKHLLVHCKNFKAISYLLNSPLTVWFHKHEDYALITSNQPSFNNKIWAHNLNEVDENCIIPLLTLEEAKKYNKFQSVFGVCSDFIAYVDNSYKKKI